MIRRSGNLFIQVPFFIARAYNGTMHKLIEKFIKPPVLIPRENGPAYACFNRLQFWLYPELCTAQFSEAIANCSDEQREKQIKLFDAYFRGK